MGVERSELRVIDLERLTEMLLFGTADNESEKGLTPVFTNDGRWAPLPGLDLRCMQGYILLGSHLTALDLCGYRLGKPVMNLNTVLTAAIAKGALSG